MHVMACLDLSAITQRVVVVAASLAAKFGGELTLLHVAAPEIGRAHV